MAVLVVFTLLVSLVAVTALLVAAFLDVAFAEPAVSSARDIAWQPPLIHGPDLFAWARGNAAQVTRQWLQNPHAGDTVELLAEELRAGTDTALERSREAPPAWAPEEKCYSRNALTPLEAIEIATHLRWTLSPREVQGVAERAAQNRVRAHGLDRQAYQQAHIACPLRAAHGGCLLTGAEPLQCRVGCQLEHSAGTSGQERPADELTAAGRARMIALGVEQGFSDAAESLRLEGGRCEFNAALATALGDPDAAERWSKGERLFADCARISV